jgi:carbonic anhydrase
LQEVISRSSIVNDMFSSGQIGLVGAVYNVENGSVDFFKDLT